jgi:hypothetical protein
MTINRHGKGKVSSAVWHRVLVSQLLVARCTGAGAGTGTATFVTLSGRQGPCVDPVTRAGPIASTAAESGERDLLGAATCTVRSHSQGQPKPGETPLANAGEPFSSSSI